MDLKGAVVLITGSSSGIGLAIAERFADAGSKVIVSGRRAERLQQIKSQHPSIDFIVADVQTPNGRVALFEEATKRFPQLNVLVNNAGIQHAMKLAEAADTWDAVQSEIATNFEAPVHLTQLFIPHLLKQANPTIINVTSGLSFCPKADVPVYCATKAALHSFTLSTRHQLSTTQPPIKVVEIIPPAVNTDLGGVGKHTFGVPLADFADSVFERVAAGEIEVPYGMAAQVSQASRADLDEAFKKMNMSSAEEQHKFVSVGS